MEGDWQPIETAARTNHRYVLVWAETGGYYVALWHRGEWRHGEKGRPVFPTHWMPLPEPPPL